MVRRHVGRIDHVIWVVHQKNLARYAHEASELLGVQFDHMHGPSMTGKPREAYVSWESGIEFMTPLEADDDIARDRLAFLESHGEGIWGVVFGVEDIQASTSAAQERGYPGSPLRQNPDRAERLRTHKLWTRQVSDVQETHIGKLAGSHLQFGQIDYL